MLERALRVGDGSGRNWRSWMAPATPMARKWRELVAHALERGWLTMETSQALMHAAAENAESGREERPRVPPVTLPFFIPPYVPAHVWLLEKHRVAPGADLDAASAGAILADWAIDAARRPGSGLGSGGARAKRRRRWLEATPEGRAWLKAVAALQKTVERLGLVDRPESQGHPGIHTIAARDAARATLRAALQAAYERAGYPPPPQI